MSAAEIEHLLADDAWLRRLARSLAGDAATADDLVQETWIAALSGAEAARRERSWLAGTLRNRWRQLLRGEVRRKARERDAKPRERDVGAPADEVALELVLRRAVVDALLELEEPYRAAVFRRFFKEASLASIAAEDGIAISTVHARVERGLERLRARLDAAHEGKGGRRAWALGVLRLTLPREPCSAARASGGSGATGAAAWLAGGIAMTKALKLAASGAALALGLTGAWYAAREATGAAPAEVAAPPGAPLERWALAPELAEAPAVQAEPAARHEVALKTTIDQPAAISPVVRRGRVVDHEGAPLAGVTVQVAKSARQAHGSARDAHGSQHDAHGSQQDTHGSREEAHGSNQPAKDPLATVTSDGDGRFALELADASAHLTFEIDDPRWRLVAALEQLEGEALLIAGPRGRYAGVVLDPDGVPLPDAEVQIRVMKTIFQRAGVPFEVGVELPEWSARTDAEGRFLFEDALGGEHAFVHVPPGLYQGVGQPLPPHDDLALELRLSARKDVRAVSGVVQAPDGSPFGGAKVSLGSEITESDRDGRFELVWDLMHDRREAEARASGMHPPRMPQTHVAAVARGFGPARVELTEELVHEPVVLRLAERPLAITGRVVDAAGAPLARVQVWLTDPTHFGSVRRNSAEMTWIEGMTLEQELGGADATETDASGRFRLDGLSDRSYSLQAFDPRTFAFGPGWTVAAGATDVELRLVVDPSATRVAGRVISLRGKPLAGVDIRPTRKADLDAARLPHGVTLAGVTTDAGGRFEFPPLALEGLELLLMKGPESPTFVEHVTPADHDDPARLEIVIPLTCELQVLLRDSKTATEMRILDADGAALVLYEYLGSFISTTDVAELAEGRSSVLGVSELARELVLLRDGKEVARLPLAVDPVRRTVVEY